MSHIFILKAPTNFTDAFDGRGISTAAEKETADVAAAATAEASSATAANESEGRPSLPDDFRDVSTECAAKKTSADPTANDCCVTTKVLAFRWLFTECFSTLPQGFENEIFRNSPLLIG